MTLLSPRSRLGNATYTMAVTVDWHSVRLHLTGDIDLAAASELTRTLESIDRMPAMRLHVDMARVTFMDSSGVRPLVDAARRRRDYDWPALLIDGISRPAKRLLTLAGLGEGPHLDVAGWDRLVAGDDSGGARALE
jgi:anti-sigma B factor antagonist